MRALALLRQIGQSLRRLRAPLVDLGHASEQARHQPVQPLLQRARLLALRLQHGRCLLTLRPQRLDLGRQSIDLDPQMLLQRSSARQPLADFGEPAHLETIAL